MKNYLERSQSPIDRLMSGLVGQKKNQKVTTNELKTTFF